MERDCENCGVSFKAFKNRRLCDECTNLMDLGTKVMEGFKEEKDKNGLLKSKKVGFFFIEDNRVYFKQTKFGVANPIIIEKSKMLKPKFDEFHNKHLKSSKKVNKKDKIKEQELESKNTRIILKDSKIYIKQIIDGTENLKELHGAFIYPPYPKEYPVYQTECTECNDIFITFSNKTKYCPDCSLDKHAEHNRKYKKLIKKISQLTPDEIIKIGEHGKILKDRSLDKPGSLGLGANRNPDYKREAEIIRKEKKRLGL